MVLLLMINIINIKNFLINEYMDIQNTSNLQYNSLKNYIRNNKKNYYIITFSTIAKKYIRLAIFKSRKND